MVSRRYGHLAREEVTSVVHEEAIKLLRKDWAMKFGILDWSNANGEGTVLFTREFREASWIEQMDAMVDWMAQLQKEYNSRLAEYVGRGGKAGLPPPDDVAPTD